MLLTTPPSNGFLLPHPHRMHDVQVHWESVCKLLDETILILEATKSQMCKSNRSQCSEEFNWLERTEGCLREQRAIHDRREVIDEEINLHEVGLGRRKQGWRMEGAGPVD